MGLEVEVWCPMRVAVLGMAMGVGLTSTPGAATLGPLESGSREVCDPAACEADVRYLGTFIYIYKDCRDTNNLVHGSVEFQEASLVPVIAVIDFLIYLDLSLVKRESLSVVFA